MAKQHQLICWAAQSLLHTLVDRHRFKPSNSRASIRRDLIIHPAGIVLLLDSNTEASSKEFNAQGVNATGSIVYL